MGQGLFFHRLPKDVAAFCPCLKNMPEAKLEGFVLISVAEEFLRQPYIDCVMWLLVVTLIQIYKKKRSQAKRNKSMHFEKSKNYKKCNVEAIACAERHRERWSEESGTLGVRPCLADYNL